MRTASTWSATMWHGPQFTHAARSPDIITREIADDLAPALEQSTKITARLVRKSAPSEEKVEAVQD